MANVSHGLMIKYGLPSGPSDYFIQRWRDLTNENIRNGMSREAAGDTAAKAVFPGYRTHIYASEADTIEMLLQQVADKK